MIGERIKSARLSLGYSAEQVAAFLHVSPATIYRYENGDISKLPSKFIRPLADFLCVTPEYLMGWSDEIIPTQSHASTAEARIISSGIDRMPKERREQALKILQAAFTEYADYFKEDPINDTKDNA